MFCLDKQLTKLKYTAVIVPMVCPQENKFLFSNNISNGGQDGYYILGNGYIFGYATSPSWTWSLRPTTTRHSTWPVLAATRSSSPCSSLGKNSLRFSVNLLHRGADIEHRKKKAFAPLILAATDCHDKVNNSVHHGCHFGSNLDHCTIRQQWNQHFH